MIFNARVISIGNKESMLILCHQIKILIDFSYHQFNNNDVKYYEKLSREERN